MLKKVVSSENFLNASTSSYLLKAKSYSKGADRKNLFSLLSSPQKIASCSGKKMFALNLSIIIILLLSFFAWRPCLSQISKSKTTTAVDEDCVTRIKTKYPKYTVRFKEEFLNRSCEKSRVWKNDAINGVGKAAKNPLLTAKQKQYFDSVTTCKGLQCLCDQWQVCRDFVAKLKQGLGSLGDLSDKLKNGNIGDLFNGLSKGKGTGTSTVTGPDRGTSSLTGRKKRQVDLNAQVNLLQKFGKSTRKEIRAMTEDERKRLFVALNTLKTDKIDGWSKYDILIIYHTPEYAPEAHFGGAFLPFHRELLKNIELALRMVDPTVSLPYWDSTLDSNLPNPADSVLWTDEFLGNGNGDVTTGPFGNWTTIPDAQIPDLSPSKRIVRGVGQSPFGSVFKESDVQTILAKPDFRSLVFCVDPFYELVHGANHMFVGGHMIELRISPNDPTFFLVHTWVDHIWEMWRQSRQTANQRPTVYVADNETCNDFSKPTDLLKPYQATVMDGLSEKYTTEFYSYQARPTSCSVQNPTCQNSPYLFCDTVNSRCMSKVKANGNCTGFDGKDICYKGLCTNGICVPTTQPDPTTAVVTDTTTTTAAPTTTTTTPAPTTTTTTAAPTTTTTTPAPTTTTTTAATTTTTTATTTTTTTTKAPTTTTTTATTTTTTAKATTTPAPPATPPTQDIVPVTAPPQTGTQPPVPATVWFPITVLLVQQGNASAAYPKAKILTRATSNGKTYEGIFAKPDDQPYYTGAAYGQMPNPFAGTSPVTASLVVYDEFNKACTSLCLQNETSYLPCSPSVTLDVDPTKSDKIPTTPNLALAKLLNWKGYHRALDKFMFLCDTKTATPSPSATTVTAAPFTGSTSTYNISIGGGKYINIVTTNDAAHQIANGGCHNLHRCCSLWADVGECTRNPWMQVACEWACHVCNPGENVTADVCCDYHPRCAEWASGGQCTKNPTWMEENCKDSCKVCSRSIDDLGVVCGIPKKSAECKDYQDGCAGWAKKNECVNNPWWMKENCPKSCKVCT